MSRPGMLSFSSCPITLFWQLIVGWGVRKHLLEWVGELSTFSG
jgi:hypothetical protein